MTRRAVNAALLTSKPPVSSEPEPGNDPYPQSICTTPLVDRTVSLPDSIGSVPVSWVLPGEQEM